MREKNVVLLMALVVLLGSMVLTACSNTAVNDINNKTENTKAPVDNSGIPGDSTGNKGGENGIVEDATEMVGNLDVKYIRNHDMTGGSQAVICISSKEELVKYYNDNKDNFLLDSSYGKNSFAEAMEEYDEDFFKASDLIIVRLEHGSGSVKDTVLGVEFGTDASGQKTLKPIISTTYPEIGTCDMAYWHILITVSKKFKSSERVLLSPSAPDGGGTWYENIKDSKY